MAGAKGLGRGLDVLLGGMAVGRDNPEVVMLKLEDVRPNPRQPRLEFDPAALEDLTNSIREQGVLQPVMVRPSNAPGIPYELVAGERRLRASRLAGLAEIPAIVRDVTDEQSLAIALIENLQRENLNSLEEAKGLDQLQKTFGLSQEALAQKVGKSRPAVANSLRLLQLPEVIQESLFKDAITAGHARALLSVGDVDAQIELWRRASAQGLSVRETEELAAHWKQTGALPEEGGKPRPEREPAQKRRRQPLSQELNGLAVRLRDKFKSNVKIGGDEAKGKITFAYSSQAELQALLEAWGLPDD